MNNETIKPTIPEGWTEWVYSDATPFPENPETPVNVMFRDGTLINIAVYTVSWYGNESDDFGNWKQMQDDEDIIAYKVAEEK